jgi:glycosyltransferase involved in cell wall biosynthesis
MSSVNAPAIDDQKQYGVTSDAGRADRARPAPVTLSVLVPNYNHGRLIGRALQALADQTRPAHEIIVIDDCSSDDSVSVVESFGEKLPQLRLIRHGKNLGVNASTNRGLEEARGSYVVCSAADDWLEASFLDKMAAATEALGQPRFCTSQFVQFLEEENRFLRHGQDAELGHWYIGEGEAPRFYSPGEVRQIFRRGYAWLPTTGAVIHRDTMRAIGGYDPNLRWHSDWFVIYAIAFRYGFAIVPEPLSVFCVTASNYSGGMYDPTQQRAVCNAIFDKLREPAFGDIAAAVRECPAVLAPFIRAFLFGLMGRPEAWPFVRSAALWWLNQVRMGRRPGFVRDVSQSLGIRTVPR